MIGKLIIPEIYYQNYPNEISLIIISINVPFVVIGNFIIHHSFEEKLICSICFLLITILVCIDRLCVPLDFTDSNAFHLAAIGAINYSTPYTKCISLFYDMFGILRMLAQYLNAMFFFSASCYLKKIFDILQIEKKSRIFAFSLLLLSPFFLKISSVLRRETFIAFLLTASFFYFVKWLSPPKKKVYYLHSFFLWSHHHFIPDVLLFF